MFYNLKISKSFNSRQNNDFNIKSLVLQQQATDLNTDLSSVCPHFGDI